MLKKALFLLYPLAVVTAPLAAQQSCLCETTSINFSTGIIRPANTLIPVGGSDAAWTLVTAPTSSLLFTPATPFVIEPLTIWGSGTPSERASMVAQSRWISPFNSTTYETNNPAPDSPFVFEFKLCVCKPGTFRFAGMANADDQATVTVDNSTTIVSCPGWNNVYSFNTLIPLTAGNHTLRIRLRNTGGQKMGINLTGTLTATGTASLIGYDCCNKTGGIRGQKFEDKNCNGRLDMEDTPLQGWTVTLMPGGATAVTDVLGYYFFPNLAPGTYTVTETNQPGWTPIFPISTSVTVTPGTVQTVNFLNSKCINSRCNDTCYWKVTGNNIIGGNNIFGTLTEDDVLIQSAAANRGIITRKGLLGWNTVSPTAYLHVNCNGNNQENGTLSDVRFERLERGTGNIMVINTNGYVMDSKVPLSSITNAPAALQTMQQQVEQEKLRNDRLEQELRELKAQLKMLTGQSADKSENGSRLLQNTPNPFGDETEIGYVLESAFKTAAIVVSDADGKEIARYPLSGAGQGSIRFRNTTLAPGVFYYTLYMDGHKVDTRKMVYTRN